MGTGYTRNDTGNNIADGNVINASDLDGEFDALEDAFDGSTGHSHDGTTGEGPQIDTAGLANDAVTAAKLDETESFTMAGLTVTTADINGGTIDGTNIGASTPGTGVFTSLETEGAWTEDAEAITSSSNTATLDLSTATNFTHTLTENVTYTFSNPATSGKASAFTLKVTQDSTARTITWPASVDWAGGTAPTISDTDGYVDYFVFITTDGGTTYYGFVAGQNLATPA